MMFWTSRSKKPAPSSSTWEGGIFGASEETSRGAAIFVPFFWKSSVAYPILKSMVIINL